MTENKNECEERKKNAMEKFKKDNMVLRITWNSGISNQLKQKENVAVLPRPGLYVLIVEDTEITMIRWGQVIEMVFPPNNKITDILIAAVDKADKFAKKMMDDKPDGREGFQ